MLERKFFYSKILLFGEYSIIKESMGLATPYRLFSGKLAFKKNNVEQNQFIDSELRAFVQYLKKMSENGNEIIKKIDITSLEFDIGQGLYFDSSIPQGYGVGSSGALCAAIYDTYGDYNSLKPYSISVLKNIFAELESHFHGASSGIDPLISFLNESILIKNISDIGHVNLPNYSHGKGGIFLLNTGRARRTEPLVNLFLEKSNTKKFSELSKNVLLPITNGCINSFLEGETDSLYEFFRELSDFQFRHFLPMIPKLFQDVWKEGLQSEKFYLKLCGAGGGGFLLGVTRDFSQVRASLSQYEIKRLFQI